MNTRKLFALLTFVAFIMTLLPVAAFAADRYASIVKVDTTEVEADGVKDAEFTVYVRNSDNSAAANETVYVASERGATDKFYQGETELTAVNNFYELQTDENGKVEFEVKSQVAGEATIAIGLNNQVYNYLVDSDVTAANAEIIGTETIVFEATDASDVQVVSATDRDDATLTVTETETTAGEREYTIDDVTVNANGVDYYEIKFAVKNGSGAPVEGEDIELSTSKNGVTFNKSEITTDEIGEATVKVYATKPGTYDILATNGDNEATVTVEFLAGEVYDLKLESDVEDLLAIDVNDPDTFKIKLVDANGNKVNPNNIALDEELDFEWITEPEDSDLSEPTYSATTDNLVEVTIPELEYEGKYELRVNIDNGKYIDIDFEGREQGDITKITLEYDQDSLPLAAKSSTPTVKRVDSQGVSVSVSNLNDIEFSVNDYRMLLDGKENLNVTTTDRGVIYTTDDDKYAGTIVVTAVDTKENLTANYEIAVGKEAIGIEIDAPEGTVNVGEEATLTLKVVDVDGNKVALGSDVKEVDFYAYVTKKPEGAIASADEETKFSTNLIEKGEAEFDVLSNKEGKVTYTIVIKVKDESDAVKYTFAKNVTVDFAKEAPVVKVGAENVTMFIGSTGYVVDGEAKVTDVAPFIKDSRTFVPVRMISEALGAEVEWDAATQTVTIERVDKTITLTIGSNVLTVSDGSTIVSDVAPFITDGRTVLPFRVIGEAFGADVEAVFAADGTVTAVTFQQ